MAADTQELLVFSKDAEGFPMRNLLGAITSAGHPAEFGIGIAGSATEEDLDSENWDALFLRWTEPEMHEIALLEKDMRSGSEEAEATIAATARQIAKSNDVAGQLIVADHLKQTKAIYRLQILTQLLSNDDHAGWDAIDILLRCIASQSDGLIEVPGEGYCDADGELLLADNEFENEEESFPEDALDEEEPDKA